MIHRRIEGLIPKDAAFRVAALRPLGKSLLSHGWSHAPAVSPLPGQSAPVLSRGAMASSGMPPRRSPSPWLPLFSTPPVPQGGPGASGHFAPPGETERRGDRTLMTGRETAAMGSLPIALLKRSAGSFRNIFQFFPGSDSSVFVVNCCHLMNQAEGKFDRNLFKVNGSLSRTVSIPGQFILRLAWAILPGAFPSPT